MDKKIVLKWVFLAALVFGSLAVIWPPKEKIPLGLDLQGGLSFTVQIDEAALRDQILEEARIGAGLPEGQLPGLSEADIQGRLPRAKKTAQERALEVIRNRVDGMGISEPIIYPEQDSRVVIQLPGISSNQIAEATRAIQSAAFLKFCLVHQDNASLVQKIFDSGKPPEGYEVVTLDEGGRDQQYLARIGEGKADFDIDKAAQEKLSRHMAPYGYDLVLERKEVNNRKVYTPYYVNRKAELDGTKLKSARVDYRGMNEPVVAIQFNKDGAGIFARLTTAFAPNGSRNQGRNVGRQLAIILDNTLYSAPVIREPISGGNAEISGSFKVEEAYFLSNVLKAGSLPAPVTIIEKLQVSPTLGKDAVRSGITASIIGLLAVAFFMLLYYRVTGLVANITLLFNMIILPMGMLFVAGTLGVMVAEARAGSKIALPVLTLPGIAGIVLTIGMAVDANVLIFERIREEFKTGKSLAASIAAGFDRAFTAIFDSNLTTILTALILFIFGSGPIRGYAVTLSAGLIVSLYTAVVVGRMILDLIASRTSNPKVLCMTELVPFTKIDFIAKGKYATTFSIVVIVLTMGWMGYNAFQDRSRVFGMDFTGGTSVTMSYASQTPIENVRSALEEAGVMQPFIQYQDSNDRKILLVKASSIRGGEGRAPVDEVIGETLKSRFPEAGYSVLQSNVVGPQISSELGGKAVKAMLLALLVMIVYISLRFEFGFALGAVLALFHDALFTLGIMYLLGKQINMTIVAAIMTIIGYSVNDTIVIFDRIREDIKLVRGKSFVELCNLSINQTLSRTLLTSFLTLLAVVALVIYGGGDINDFALTMLVGILVGCYSTVYIATPIVLAWYKYKAPDFSKK